MHPYDLTTPMVETLGGPRVSSRLQLPVDEPKLDQVLLSNLILVLLKLNNIPVGMDVSTVEEGCSGCRQIDGQTTREGLLVLGEGKESLNDDAAAVFGFHHAGVDSDDSQIRMFQGDAFADLDHRQLRGGVARHARVDEGCGKARHVDDGACAARGLDEPMGHVVNAADVRLLISIPFSQLDLFGF